MCTYGIMCEVSGGHTGTNVAWLRENGVIWTGPFQVALAKARELHRRTANNPWVKATFRYTPTEYLPDRYPY